MDESGFSALHYACFNKNIALINILLFNEAEIDIQSTPKKITPLMIGCE